MKGRAYQVPLPLGAGAAALQGITALWHRVRTAASAEIGADQAARGEAAGNDAALERGILLLSASVCRTDPDHAARPGRLSNLGAALISRYERVGERVDLDAAIEAHEEAVARSRHDDLERVTMLSNAAMALHTRHDLTGSISDLNRAAILADQAYRGSSDRHPEWTVILVNRSAVLLQRHMISGSRGDLHEAVRMLREAASRVVAGVEKSTIQTNLGSSLHTLFAAEGDGGVLDEAIAVYRTAATLSRSTGGDVARSLSHLGSGLRSRYSFVGREADLLESNAVHREALALTPERHPSRAQRLASLATALATLHERTGAVDALDEAIELLDQAVGATPEGHGDRAAHLRNRGVALTTRGEAQGRLDDFDRAIASLRTARAVTAATAVTWPGISSSLGHAYGDRFDLTGEPADLDAAVAAHLAAVESLAVDHVDRARICTDCGDALLTRYARTGTEVDLAQAHDLFGAWTNLRSPPRDRARAGFRHAHTARLMNRIELSASTYREAIDLFELVVPGWLPITDAQHLLAELNGAASEAAAAMLDLGDPESALEALEHGRALLLGYALNRHADLTQLRAQDRSLAERYEYYLDALNRPTAESGPEVDYRTIRQELDRTLGHIRALPGQRTFGTHPRVREMMAGLPAPVVTINVTETRCDALILTTTGCEQLPLPALLADEAEAQAQRFDIAIARRNDYAIHAVLAWLWDVAAEPILLHLGHHAVDATKPAGRVIWSPTGPLSLLPLHAAGHHRTVNDVGAPRTDRTVLDRVVSSYTPTVRALHTARRRSEEPTCQSPVLVVAMPITPGHPDLPRAADDAAILSTYTDGQPLVLGPDRYEPATFATVSAALRNHRWVHFSCHAISDRTDPSRSRLLLQDHRTHPMSIAAIADLDLFAADLAFLAACTTAGADPDLADEPIHLAAAFRGLGVRHVIATLWPISDESAAQAARIIYRHLLSTVGLPDWSASGAAAAVHAAMADLRSATPGRPSNWAAYAHYGP